MPLSKCHAEIHRRIAQAFLEKSVVPFLGAGFSYGARHPDFGWVSLPCLMPCQLQQWLGQKISCERDCPTFAAKTLGNLRDAASLSHLAELGHTLFGALEVCETLHIHQYATLGPEPQHRYLAYLVREGLVNEVITTNYDCCLETAFRESFDPGTECKMLGVVRNLEEYRQEGSRHRQDGQLLLYKINGCAEAYRLARETRCQSKTSENRNSWDAEAQRIILTERQLQNFRDQDWARDMVRDRFRGRHLFFSGFGNDEPQIRHTVLALIQEFGDGQARAQADSPEKAMGQPNAPFLHSYEGTLTFNQLQMLVAFMDAHSAPRLDLKPPADRIQPLYRNILGPVKLNEKLAASTMMRRVFQDVYLRLVREALEEDKPFALWLRKVTPEWRIWTGLLQLVLDPANPCALTRGRVRSLLEPNPCFPLPLYRYLWCIRYPTSANGPNHTCPPGWYLPLREDSLFILLTLLWICQSCWRFHPAEISAFGLRLTLGSGGNVHLIARDALRELQTGGMGSDDSRLLRLILIPSLRADADRWGRWRHERGRRLWPGLWVAVESADLIRESRRPGHLKEEWVWSAFAAMPPRQPAASLRHLSTDPRRMRP